MIALTSLQKLPPSQILRKHRLVIIGEGPDRPILNKLIVENHLENCVELAGHLPLTDKPALIAGYVRELESLALDPQKRAQLGAAAQSYARILYTWDAKARKIVEVYEWVLGRRQQKPEFDPSDDVTEVRNGAH